MTTVPQIPTQRRFVTNVLHILARSNVWVEEEEQEEEMEKDEKDEGEEEKEEAEKEEEEEERHLQDPRARNTLG